MPPSQDTSPRDEWPHKAYKNPDFLNSEPARNIRILCEMTEPGLRFAKEQIRHSIVLFGSARALPVKQAKAELASIEAALAEVARPTPQQTRALQTAQANMKAAPYYEDATSLAEKLTRWSMSQAHDGACPYTICSGGGPGIMEAANLGARRAGGKSIGLGISLPFEQSVNEHIPEDLKFQFHYFFVRKFWFVSMAKALIAFPGGFGTLDELFETLTLVQTQKIEDKPVIVLFGSAFWNNVARFDSLLEWGVISPKDLELFRVIDDVDEAANHIISELETRFKTPPQA